MLRQDAVCAVGPWRSAETDHFAVQRRGLRRRQVVGDDNGFVRQIDGGSLVAAQHALDASGHIAQVGGAPGSADPPSLRSSRRASKTSATAASALSRCWKMASCSAAADQVINTSVRVWKMRACLAQFARHPPLQFQQLAAGQADRDPGGAPTRPRDRPPSGVRPPAAFDRGSPQFPQPRQAKQAGGHHQPAAAGAFRSQPTGQVDSRFGLAKPGPCQRHQRRQGRLADAAGADLHIVALFRTQRQHLVEAFYVGGPAPVVTFLAVMSA